MADIAAIGEFLDRYDAWLATIQDEDGDIPERKLQAYDEGKSDWGADALDLLASLRQPETGRLLLCWGNVIDGFHFIGPVVANDPALEEWAEQLRQDWWYVPLETPPWITEGSGA